jgi:acyl-CoA thioesterase YciA
MINAFGCFRCVTFALTRRVSFLPTTFEEQLEVVATLRIPAIKVLLLPKDTNAHGTIFGGVILSHIDLASAIEARTVAAHRYVTKAMREVEFHEPVFVGDIISFYTQLVRVGRTSITIRVTVEAERWGVPPTRMGMTGHGELVKVTEAEVILVAVNDQGRPIPIRPEAGG